MLGGVGVAHKNRIKYLECERKAFKYTKVRVPPGSHKKIWLTLLNNSVDWQETETHLLRDKQKPGTSPDTVDKESCLARGCYSLE